LNILQTGRIVYYFQRELSWVESPLQTIAQKDIAGTLVACSYLKGPGYFGKAATRKIIVGTNRVEEQKEKVPIDYTDS
jgi:hypothetical protein